jgi:integrase
VRRGGATALVPGVGAIRGGDVRTQIAPVAPLVVGWMRRYFKPALKRAGLGESRFHDLRHTFASMMFAAGVDVYKVSRWMGRANISTTDSIYPHLYLTDHSNESARVAKWLGTERAAAGHIRQDVTGGARHLRGVGIISDLSGSS